MPSCGDDSSFESKHGKNGSRNPHSLAATFADVYARRSNIRTRDLSSLLAMSAGALAADPDHERARGDGIVLEKFPVGAALFHA